MSRCVIVIHGVGQTSPASIGGTVSDTLGFGTTEQTVVRHSGTTFVEFRDWANGNTVLEVHWADLMRPRATALSILLHVWRIITSMVDVALDGNSTGRSLFIRTYRFFVFPITIGAGALALATAVGVAIDDRWLRATLLGALIALLAVAALRLRRYGAIYNVLWIWTALIAIGLLLSWTAPLPAGSLWVRTGTKARELGFQVAVIALTLSSIEIWFGSKWRGNTDVRCALMALLYLPFIAMNGLMAWVGLLGMSGIKLIGPDAAYRAWERAAYPSFDLRLFELGATVAFSALGLLFFALTTGGYFAGRAQERSTNDALGQLRASRARDGFSRFLRSAPFILIALGIYCTCIQWGTDQPANTSIIEIYRISVLRTLPFMAWLIGPFAIAADVAGDILFYLQPGVAHPSAMAERCRQRLRAVIDYARKDPQAGPEVVVLAHSQGSKIAADLRAANELPGALVTCGSPVSTLYERFLGERVHDKVETAGWINAYRAADFIGGPIAAAQENVRVGPPDGHTDYWSDKALPDLIERALASSGVVAPAGGTGA